MTKKRLSAHEHKGTSILSGAWQWFCRIARWIGGASFLCQRFWTAMVARRDEQISITNNL